MKKNWFGILLLSFLISVLAPVYAKNLKFAQVTDINYRKQSEVLVNIIRDINREPDIDFVVFTGNNIGKATKPNLRHFLNDLKRLHKPYYIVLGNKDVSKTNDLDKETYMNIVRKYNHTHPKTTNYTFKKKDIVFIVVDGSKDLIPSANGFYNKDTIEWVNKQLTKYNKNKVIIIQHFPIANKPNNEFYYTYNILEYMQMLSKHTNVMAVISGHYDKNDEITHNGILHITTPRSSKGSYKIIDVDIDNNAVYTFLKEI